MSNLLIERSESDVSEVIERVFSATLSKKNYRKLQPANCSYTHSIRVPLFLENLSKKIQNNRGKALFSVDDIEDVVTDMLNMLSKVTSNQNIHPSDLLEGFGLSRNGIQYLITCHSNLNSSDLFCCWCEEKKLDLIRKSLLPKISDSVVSCMAILLQAPEVFGLSKTDVLKNFSVEGSQIPESILLRIVDRILQNDPDDASVVFGPTITEIYQMLSCRSLNDLQKDRVKFLLDLVSVKQIAKECTKLPCFAHSDLPSNKINGHILENESILGRLLAPTPIDGPAALGRKIKDRLATKHFRSVGYEIDSRSPIVKNIRLDVLDAVTSSKQCIHYLLRTDFCNRQSVLLWMGYILRSIKRRDKLAHRIQSLPFSVNPSVEYIRLKLTGEISFGFALNLFWVLCMFLKPIDSKKITLISPYYFVDGCSVHAQKIFGDFMKQSVRFGDADKIIKIAKKYCESPNKIQDHKFPTEIFWIAVTSISLLFNPALRELEALYYSLGRVDELKKKPTLFEDTQMEIISFQCVIYCHEFLESLWVCADLIMNFVLRSLFVNENTHESTVDDWSSFLLKNSPSAPLPANDSFLILPCTLVDDLFEMILGILRIRLYRSTTPVNQHSHVSNDDPLYWLNDKGLLVSFCTVVMLSPNHFTSIHSRCHGAAGVVSRLLCETPYSLNLKNMELAKEYLVRALIRSFVDSQKADYNDRIQLRVPLVDALNELVTFHKSSFRKIVRLGTEDSVRFVHLLLSDISWLIEEGTSHLVLMRKRECANENRSVSENSVNTSTGETGPDGIDGESDLGNDRTQISFESLQLRTKGFVQHLHRTMNLFKNIVGALTRIIAESRALLPQAVTCLDCCLNHLCGPRCLELKVKDTLLGFKPRQLLDDVVQIFSKLVDSEAQSGDIVKEIHNDGRYYDPKVFSKAVRILRREGISEPKCVSNFENLVKKLLQYHNISEIDNIPDEYLDPIMQDLMEDPVQLPSSKVIMDRKHIERHLMSDPHDPYNRSPLCKEDLISMTDLKEKIEQFLASEMQRNLSC